MKQYTYHQIKEMKRNINNISIQEIKEVLELDNIDPFKINNHDISPEDAEYLKWWYEENLRGQFRDFLDECLEEGKMVFKGEAEYICEHGKIKIINLPFTMYYGDKCCSVWNSVKESFIYDYMKKNKLHHFDFINDWTDKMEEELKNILVKFDEKETK